MRLDGRTLLLAMVGWVCIAGAQVDRLSPALRSRGEAVASRLEAYLLSQQDDATGGWRVNPDGVTFPAITALALNGMLLNPDADTESDEVRAAVDFLLSFQQDDGGIYDTVLPSYNTACAISALSRVRTPEAREAVEKALEFLLTLQWSDQPDLGPGAARVSREHPFYGGVGYGSSSRPDGSNLALFMQALQDGGYEHDGPAVQRALMFLSRIQMDGEINDMPYAEGSTQGGMIYSTGPKGDRAGEGESKAGMIEETLSDGTSASRLRAYGSMTYAGFKSFAYANLKNEDPRVQAAKRWISEQYTLSENPGIGTDGYYYYLMVFGRALDAWDEPRLETSDGERAWAVDLIAQLESLQQPDGSVRSLDDRWMENDPVLISAYCLIALRHALSKD